MNSARLPRSFTGSGVAFLYSLSVDPALIVLANCWRCPLGSLSVEFASNDRSGWTVGGGLEYMFGPGWSVFGEYNYMDFGKPTGFVPTELLEKILPVTTLLA